MEARKCVFKLSFGSNSGPREGPPGAVGIGNLTLLGEHPRQRSGCRSGFLRDAGTAANQGSKERARGRKEIAADIPTKGRRRPENERRGWKVDAVRDQPWAGAGQSGSGVRPSWSRGTEPPLNERSHFAKCDRDPSVSLSETSEADLGQPEGDSPVETQRRGENAWHACPCGVERQSGGKGGRQADPGRDSGRGHLRGHLDTAPAMSRDPGGRPHFIECGRERDVAERGNGRVARFPRFACGSMRSPPGRSTLEAFQR